MKLSDFFPSLCKVLLDKGFKVLRITILLRKVSAVLKKLPRLPGFAREFHRNRGQSSKPGSNVQMCFYFFPILFPPPCTGFVSK